MNGKQLLAAGLIGVSVFLLLRSRTANASATGATIYNTDGDAIRLQQGPGGVVVDQYGKVWT